MHEPKTNTSKEIANTHIFGGGVCGFPPSKPLGQQAEAKMQQETIGRLRASPDIWRVVWELVPFLGAGLKGNRQERQAIFFGGALTVMHTELFCFKLLEPLWTAV